MNVVFAIAMYTEVKGQVLVEKFSIAISKCTFSHYLSFSVTRRNVIFKW